jgi:hypothetical protein
MGMTVGEIQFANRAIGCMERIADALEKAAEPKADPVAEQWKSAAVWLAYLLEDRAKEYSLNEYEMAALLLVAKLSKAD